jgi:uncharacterized protein
VRHARRADEHLDERLRGGQMTVRTWLIEMTDQECADLLAGSSLGRVGVVVDGRPEIYPVNHVFDRERGCVAFPTNDRTKLHAALSWPWVAYEVDGVDADGAGWSVLVVGAPEEVTDPGDLTRLAEQRQVLWRSGPMARWIRIVPAKMTGRRISVEP